MRKVAYSWIRAKPSTETVRARRNERKRALRAETAGEENERNPCPALCSRLYPSLVFSDLRVCVLMLLLSDREGETVCTALLPASSPLTLRTWVTKSSPSPAPAPI